MSSIETFVTPVFRASFVNVFQAASYNGGAPKYSLHAVWEPAKFSELDKKRFDEMMKHLEREAQSGFRKAYKDLPASIRKPLRDGDEKEDYAGYGEGKIFASLSTKRPPGIVNLEGAPIGPSHFNEAEFYSGCYARAKVSAHAYDNVSKGITLRVYSLQKVADGKPFSSAKDAASDFAAEKIDNEWLERAATQTATAEPF